MVEPHDVLVQIKRWSLPVKAAAFQIFQNTR